MSLKLAAVVALLCFFASVNAREEDVLELTDKTFTDELSQHETALVMFYAPWCGHCKRLKPEYAKAAEILRDDDPPIKLAKIDCTEAGKENCNLYSVSGYPTLKIFRNGKVSSDYNGPREAAGIAKYMRSQVGPAARVIHSVEDFDKYLAVKEAAIFGFFEKDSDLKNVFNKYAEKMREKYRFAHSSAKDVLEKQGETDAIFLFRAPHLKNKFEPSVLKFEGTTEQDLANFIKENFHGLVGHKTTDFASDFKNPMITAYYAIDYEKNPKGTNYWRNRALMVAKDFVGKVTFAIASKDEFTHEMNEYGYDFVGDVPLFLARDARNLKYIMRKPFSVDALRVFTQKLLDGGMDPYVKSEPMPEKNDAPVKVAVGFNFDEVVIKNDKDTLIEFYAPWCGHCKKLTPIYDELAEKLIDEDVVIAKMDATANDVPPDFTVRGFPTLFWLPKDSKDTPVPYNEGRELNDFIKFIAKHATNELKGYDRSGNPKKEEL